MMHIVTFLRSRLGVTFLVSRGQGSGPFIYSSAMIYIPLLSFYIQEEEKKVMLFPGHVQYYKGLNCHDILPLFTDFIQQNDVLIKF